MMKERSILMNAESVRGILAGRKTQTRRVMKPQPPHHNWNQHNTGGKYNFQTSGGQWVKCPYGIPGDLLWVRETHLFYHTVDRVQRLGGQSYSEVSDGLCAYRADGFGTIDDFREHVRLTSGPSFEAVEIENDRWRPSVHMPRWASRIILRVTNVRVERVQDITEDDAKAEGIDSFVINIGPKSNPQRVYPAFPDKDGGFVRASQAFEALWDSINSKRGFGWDTNPWVFVISFERFD